MRTLALAALLFPTPGWAAFSGDSAGTSSGQFLKLGADARGVAMGSAVGAAAEDASAVYWNPAGLAGVERRELAFTYAALFQDISYGFVAYAHPVRSVLAPRTRELKPSGLGTLAAAILYLNAGELEEVDNTATKTGGRFTPRDLAVIAGWGGALTERLDLGVGLKYVDSRIQASARTGAADVGLRWRARLSDWPWTFAASAHNMGGALRFREQGDPLPLTLRISQALRPMRNWVIAAEAVFPRDNSAHAAFGTEFVLPVQDQRASVALRGGWTGQNSSGDLDGTAGISFGAGMGWKAFSFDYAWRPFGVLGDSHRISLSYRF